MTHPLSHEVLKNEDYPALYIPHDFSLYKQFSFLNTKKLSTKEKKDWDALLRLVHKRGLEEHATIFWLAVLLNHKKVKNNKKFAQRILQLGKEAIKAGSVPPYVFEKEAGVLINAKLAKKHVLETVTLGIQAAKKGWKAESALYWLSVLLNHGKVSKSDVQQLITIGIHSTKKNWKPESFYYYLFLLLNSRDLRKNHTSKVINLLEGLIGEKVDYYSVFHWLRLLLHQVKNHKLSEGIIVRFQHLLKNGRKPFEAYKALLVTMQTER